MFELYLEKCAEVEFAPRKKSMYYRIFGTVFNLGFHIPKSDRCDICETFKVAEQTETMTSDLKDKYDRHQLLKNHTRAERKKERENKDLPVLLFDLQNVILIPHADISSFFLSAQTKCIQFSCLLHSYKKSLLHFMDGSDSWKRG